MATEPITILVDPDAAKAFRRTSAKERKQLGFELGIWLRRRTHRKPTAADKNRLMKTMDEIGAHAQSRGLTPEILQSILDEKE